MLLFREILATGCRPGSPFCFYFSGGLNGAKIAAEAHKLTDSSAHLSSADVKRENLGDVALANAAYSLGKRVRKALITYLLK